MENIIYKKLDKRIFYITEKETGKTIINLDHIPNLIPNDVITDDELIDEIKKNF